MYIQRAILALALSASLLPFCIASQLPQPAPPAGEASANRQESSNKTHTKSKHQHDFLIKGTVFTQEGLSFAGAQIQIRKAGAKSFHWHDSANSRGEFAIRVVQGAKYEVVVSGKGHKTQQTTVDATGTDRVHETVFRLEHEGSKPS